MPLTLDIFTADAGFHPEIVMFNADCSFLGVITDEIATINGKKYHKGGEHYGCASVIWVYSPNYPDFNFDAFRQEKDKECQE
jgi:hypothetical protein